MHNQFNRLLLATTLLSCAAQPDFLMAETSVKPTEIKSEHLYNPTIMPDRILLTWAGDPKTSQAVTWRTALEVKSPQAQLIIAPHGVIEPELATTVLATNSETLKTNNNESQSHTVTFTDLTPGTIYAYRVGDGANWSEWHHFETEAVAQKSFSFIYLGDAQNGLKPHWSRLLRQAYSYAPKSKFILHAGDLVNRGIDDADWGEWFHASGFITATLPTVAIPGNHEYTKIDDNNRELTKHWRAQFEYPKSSIPGLEDTSYTLAYGDLRVIALNSNEKVAEQTPWLESVLKDNKSKWVVVTFHHPIFSTAGERDNPELRLAWKPLFDRYNVDLVLTGHDHAYGRTGIVTPPASYVPPVKSDDPAASETAKQPLPADAQGSHSGTIYIVSVSGAKMYNRQETSLMKRMAEDTQLFQVISLDGSKLTYEARTVLGDLYDGFELTKNASGEKSIVETDIHMPERQRAPKK